MARTVAWRSPLRAWMRWKTRALTHIPRPSDRPVASVAGTPAIECLALGNGPISGWGVASHQLGLVGAMARALARRFGHGVVVRATIDADWDVRDMLRASAALPWETAQVGILSFGPNEVLATARVRDWAAELRAVAREIRQRMPEGAVLAVLGIPPLAALSFFRGIGSRPLARLIERFNSAAVAVCRELDGVRFVPLPVPHRHRAHEYRSSADYASWGEAIAHVVTTDPVQVLRRAAGEAERAAAVERLGLLDGGIEPGLERVVELAGSAFRARAAAFTVLHGDRQWNKVRLRSGPAQVPRDRSFCDLAIAQGAPLVVGDAWTDPRFAGTPRGRESEMRFYAGYPVRAPDGHFVGAICVLDPEPRDPADVDVALLREFALMVEAELDRDAGGGSRPRSRRA